MLRNIPNARLRILAPLFLVSILAGAQKIETVDGVRVVHNKKGGEWGRIPKLSIELVRTIGDVDADDENLAFNSPLDMAVDDAGSIYILDSGNQRIQVFGPEGRFIRSIGRKGQGPGEFTSPNSIDIDVEGRLHVLDGSQNRIQVFTPRGEILKTIPATRLRIHRMRLLHSRSLATKSYASFVVSGTGGPGENANPKLVKLLGPDLEVRFEFGEPLDFGDTTTNSVGNSCKFAVDGKDHVCLCFLFQNRVEKYSPEGQLLWRADRELNYPAKLIERGKQETTGTRTRTVYPKFNEVAKGIATDDTGRIWVVTCDRQIKKEEVVTIMISGSVGRGSTRKVVGDTDLRTTNMFKLEVFRPDGVLLGEIPLTHFVDMIHIHKDHLFLLDRDRGMKYYQYKIVEK
jgi:sugar lactone lactonase YvrE